VLDHLAAAVRSRREFLCQTGRARAPLTHHGQPGQRLVDPLLRHPEQPLPFAIVEHLHALAVLYGGPFYESFGGLAHSVRTGRAAFDHVFGQHHFEYFAERPQLAGLFDRAMASSASIFGRIADAVDLSAASVVVDVAGGNGELLAQILPAAPHLRGVPLERPHALEAARAKLQAVGCADRCQLVTGDFTTAVPPDGDVYILSRVLHDWDDEQCRRILKKCAEAMSPKAQLLILERLLPGHDSPSLAAARDVHMLCNVGGRERTAGHYRRLLRESGFAVTGTIAPTGRCGIQVSASRHQPRPPGD
jgi:hypothetical protein